MNKASESAGFGQRLRQLRQEGGIRQGELAEKFGISAAYLSDIERGRRNPPNDQTLRQWARLLDLGQADEIGDELVALAARARDREAVETVAETVAAGSVSEGVSVPRQAAGGETPFLDHFGVDLVQQAGAGWLDPAPLAAGTLAEIAAVLARRRGGSPLLCADTSAAVLGAIHAVAGALAEGRLPKMGLLAIEGLQVGVKYRGQLEERLHTLLAEAERSGPLLLCFRSLVDVVDLEQAANGSYLGPALLEGRVQVLTGARPDQLAYARRVNPGLVEGFRDVHLVPVGRDEVLGGLFAVRDRYGAHHGVKFGEEALEAIVEAAGDDEGRWERALDLLDEVGARQGRGEAGEVGAVQVRQVAEVWAGRG